MSVDDTANVLHRVANGTVGERLAGNCLVTAEDKNNDGAVRVSWRVHVNQCRAEKLLEPRTKERERDKISSAPLRYEGGRKPSHGRLIILNT